MSVLKYKGIEFDSFIVESSGNKKYLDEVSVPQKIDQREHYGSSCYVCADCIKKYNLFEETDTEKHDMEKYVEDDSCSFCCGIKGCANSDGFDCYMDSKLCKLV